VWILLPADRVKDGPSPRGGHCERQGCLDEVSAGACEVELQFTWVGRPPNALAASKHSPRWNSRQMVSASLRPPAALALALFPMRFCLVRIQSPTASPGPLRIRRHPMAAWVRAHRRCGLPSRLMPPCLVLPLVLRSDGVSPVAAPKALALWKRVISLAYATMLAARALPTPGISLSTSSTAGSVAEISSMACSHSSIAASW